MERRGGKVLFLVIANVPSITGVPGKLMEAGGLLILQRNCVDFGAFFDEALRKETSSPRNDRTQDTYDHLHLLNINSMTNYLVHSLFLSQTKIILTPSPYLDASGPALCSRGRCSKDTMLTKYPMCSPTIPSPLQLRGGQMTSSSQSAEVRSEVIPAKPKQTRKV